MAVLPLMRRRAVVPAMLVMLAAPVQAQDALSLRLSSLAATCAACHGTTGRAVASPVVPGLAGVPAPVLIEQLTAFKTGARPATVMQQIAKGYSDAQIEQLAAYFAAQKP